MKPITSICIFMFMMDKYHITWKEKKKIKINNNHTNGKKKIVILYNKVNIFYFTPHLFNFFFFFFYGKHIFF